MMSSASARSEPYVRLALGAAALASAALVTAAVREEIAFPVAVLLAITTAVGGALWVARPSPRLLLHGGTFVVVALSLAAQGNDAGTDPMEIAFGLSLALYVAVWYATSLAGGTRIIRSVPDAAGVLFLAGSLTVGVGIGLLNGVGAVDFRSDLTCLLGLLMFFPAREACVRLRHGPAVLAGTILALGTIASVHNIVRLRETLVGARETWEIVDVRVASGEVPIIAAFILVFLWLSVTKSRRVGVALFAASALITVGLILTKSRGSWLTALAGLGIGALLMPWTAQRRLLITLLLAGGGALVAGIAVAGRQLALIGLGFLNRIVSISTAATKDISLLNRYYESDAAWAAIVENPVLGYGWGVPLRRLNIIYGVDYVWSFIHNGYLWLWHKVGVWGLVLFVIFMIGTALRAARRSRLIPVAPRAFAAGSVGGLAALAVLALPSNPFAVLDQMLVVALVLALASGTIERARPALSA